MDYKRIEELNMRILDKAVNNVEKALINENWDCECFEAMNGALKNLYEVKKIKEHREEKEWRREKQEPIIYEFQERVAEEDMSEKTEFERCVDEIIKKHGHEKGLKALIKVLNELMEEDLKIIHNRMYENTMRKLKELK